MGACIFKQPNGLYGRYSSTIDTITHINMTKEDYINVCLERKNKNWYREYNQSDEWIKNDAIDTLENCLEDYKYCVEIFKDSEAWRKGYYTEDEDGEIIIDEEKANKMRHYNYVVRQMNNTVNPKFRRF